MTNMNKLMVQSCFEVDWSWHQDIFLRKHKAKNRGKENICGRAMTGESLAMMSLTRPCSGKKKNLSGKKSSICVLQREAISG